MDNTLRAVIVSGARKAARWIHDDLVTAGAIVPSEIVVVGLAQVIAERVLVEVDAYEELEGGALWMKKDQPTNG